VEIQKDDGSSITCPQCGLVSTPTLAVPPGQDQFHPDSQGFMAAASTESFSRNVRKHADLAAELQIIAGGTEEQDDLGCLGPYRLLRILGGGGMGIVVEAEDPQLKRKVALKVMRASIAANPSQRQRFLREAQAAAAIENDHIVPIFHVGEDRGVPYLAMPFLRGQSLNDVLRTGRLPLPQVVRIGRQIAQGLAAAHERGLIHRDIKPSNIWLESLGPGLGSKETAQALAAERAPASTDNRVRILDFGIARAMDDATRLTQPGEVMGTVGYLAPEQATGAEIDARADLFGLGCTLYRMCTGRLPFPGPDMLAILASLALDQPPAPHQLNPDITPGISRLIMQLLAKKPADRPASAADVVWTLSRIEQELTAGAASATDSGPKSPRRQPGGQVWASDANQIGIEDLDWVVFKNGIIQDFLEKRGKYFLSANKGLGKTLLLTYKRKQLTDAYHEPRQGKGPAQIFFVPEGRPFLDFMGNLHTLPASHVTFLSELVKTKRVWSFALRLSALSHHPGLFNDDDGRELEAFPRRLQVWLRGGRVEPTVVFKEMLGYNLKEVNRMIDRQENFLEQKFRQIHSGTFFFIDKVDQAIRNLPRPAWILIQAGLIEAAWDAMNANGHVKVYASIRQEAFSNYESDIKTNLYGATTILQYSDQELQHLLDQLTKCYEGGKTFKEFIQLDVVRHPSRVRAEDSFQYLRRHTLGRPRDLVIVASELSRHQKELSEGLYRTLVQETTGTMLGPNVFEEMRVFLDCLDDKPERLRFFSLLPHNILTHADVVKAYYQFNYLDPECPPFDHYSEKLHHPFWELFSAGLLGIVVQDPDTQERVQKFKQPSEIFHDSQVALPAVDFYLIHPALDWFIRKNRPKDDYHLFQHMVVGHNCPWPDHYGALVETERDVSAMNDYNLRDAVNLVLKKICVLLEAGQNPARAMESSREWQELKNHLSKKHDLLFLLLEDLIAQKAKP
jgi:serine/threonine protein kinase